jgi:hypothetical protein
MLLRRMLMLAAVLLLVGALASAVAPREPTSGRDTDTKTGATPGASPPVVHGDLPADRTVDAAVGDIIELQVASKQPDEAEIPALGLAAATDRSLPGAITFVADRAGRFAVRFRFSGKRAGVIEVSPNP